MLLTYAHCAWMKLLQASRLQAPDESCMRRTARTHLAIRLRKSVQGHVLRLVQAVQQYEAAEVVWCQEEPKNMGAWRYVKPRYETAMRELVQAPQQGQQGPAGAARELRYVGRAAAASPGGTHLPLRWPRPHSAPQLKRCMQYTAVTARSVHMWLWL